MHVENNFKLSSIIIDTTKYNKIVAVIDPKMLSAMSDILLNLSIFRNRNFPNLEKFQKLLSELQLCDEKTFYLLRKLQQLGKNSILYEFLKSLWFQKFPANMQSILSMSSELLENLVKLMDKISKVQCNFIGMCVIG